MKKKQIKKFTITYYDVFGNCETHGTDNIEYAIRQIRKAVNDNYYDIRNVYIDLFIHKNKKKGKMHNSKWHFEQNIKHDENSMICDVYGYEIFKYICKKLGWKWKYE